MSPRPEPLTCPPASRTPLPIYLERVPHRCWTRFGGDCARRVCVRLQEELITLFVTFFFLLITTSAFELFY